MNMNLGRIEIEIAIIEFLAKRGITNSVMQISFFNRDESWAELGNAYVLLQPKEDE